MNTQYLNERAAKAAGITVYRELLEMAAKAAGIKSDDQGPFIKKDMNTLYDGLQTVRISWNPLTDDGDALRLAVTLRLCIIQNDRACEQVYVENSEGKPDVWAIEEYKVDPDSATRRAIVRAAAAIGATL